MITSKIESCDLSKIFKTISNLLIFIEKASSNSITAKLSTTKKMHNILNRYICTIVVYWLIAFLSYKLFIRTHKKLHITCKLFIN